MKSTRSWGSTAAALVVSKNGCCFKERGEQVEESPLTLVEILSRDHGATPLGSRRMVMRRRWLQWGAVSEASAFAVSP
jgi:hypothetical protein